MQERGAAALEPVALHVVHLAVAAGVEPGDQECDQGVESELFRPGFDLHRERCGILDACLHGYLDLR